MHRCRVTSAAICLLLAFAARAVTGNEFFKEFRNAIREDNFPRARDLCLRKVKNAPDNRVAREFLGALESLGGTAALKNKVLNYILGAYGSQLTDDLYRAVSLARKSLEAGNDPRSLALVERLVAEVVHKGRAEDLESLCQKWAGETVEEEWPYLLLAEMYRHSGRLSQARSHSRIALQLAPMSAPVHCSLGWQEIDEFNKDEAERHFRKALELNTRDSCALAGLARLELLEGRPETALKVAYEALRIHSGLPKPRMLLALAMAQLGNHTESKKQFRIVLRLHPGHLQARFHYAGFLETRGETKAAEKEWQKYLEFDFASNRAWLIRNGLVQISRQTISLKGRNPVWSPDGRRLLCIHRGPASDEVVVQALDSPEESQTIPTGLEGKIESMDLSEDGKLLAMHVRPGRFGTPMEGIYLKDLTGKQPARFLSGVGYRNPIFSPDSKKLLLSGGGSSSMVVIDAATGKEERKLSLSRAHWSPDGRKIIGSRRDSLHRGDVWLFQMPQSKFGRRLTHDLQNSGPRFHPLGHAVTFLRRSIPGRPTICAVDSEGRRKPVTVLNGAEGAAVFQHAWSPEGQRLALDMGREGKIEIVEFGGLLPHPFQIATACHSGKLIVTVRNRSKYPVHFTLSHRIFTDSSQPIQSGRFGEKELFLNGGQSHSWAEYLEPDCILNGTTAWISATRFDGSRSVLLWRMPSAQE